MSDELKYTTTAAAIVKTLINDLPTQAQAAMDIVNGFDKEKFAEVTDFAKASKYYDNSYIPKICGEIALKTIINGIYYGYALDNGEGLAIQELPIEYCRSRFSVNGNPIVEFNMKYFDKAFPDLEYRVKILNVFPQEFSKGYLLYKQGKLPPQFQGDTEGWYMLDAGGAFKISCGHEDFPLLITAIPAIIDLDNAKELDR